MNFDCFGFMSDTNRDFMKHSENLRYGQFLMNRLSEKHPEIVIPEECNCYYDNSKADDLIRFLMTR